ncbi:MAG: hypothetical protein RJQ09_09740 [Cyclobacteriaceae bacterium]
MKYFTIIFLLIALGCQQKQETKSASNLGTIDFEVTGTPEAIKYFEEGVLLLHSFMYYESTEAFKKAQEADPDFGMAYWGEAMTYNHPLWAEQEREKALKTLNKLDTTTALRLAKLPTEFEKDMFKAVEILYGEGTKIERDDAYAEYLGELNQKYPKNHEIAAFYALALMGSVEGGRDYDVYGKGAKIAQSILNENPNHPGALHYMIHSYDDPEHASLALAAANDYSKVAPDAGHALHMPSHIYIAMGMWDDVIASNIRSYEAKLKKVDKDSTRNWNLHAYHWLLYGYLQKGDFLNAKTIMENMMGYAEDYSDRRYVKYYAIDMLGIYSAETGDWNGEFSTLRVDADELNVQSKVLQHFIDGYSALDRGDDEALQAALKQIDDEINKASNSLLTKDVSTCGDSFATRLPSEDDINASKVLRLELQAAIAMANNEGGVEALLKEAVDTEDKVSFLFGPPGIVIPSYEMYGQWLLEQQRFEEALAQFDKSLKKGPGRKLAFEGKLKAAESLGKQEIVNEVMQILGKQVVDERV